MAEKQKLRLGTLLVQKGIISDEQLESALALQKKYHRHLGDCLDTVADTEHYLLADMAKPQLDLKG